MHFIWFRHRCLFASLRSRSHNPRRTVGRDRESERRALYDTRVMNFNYLSRGITTVFFVSAVMMTVSSMAFQTDEVFERWIFIVDTFWCLSLSLPHHPPLSLFLALLRQPFVLEFMTSGDAHCTHSILVILRWAANNGSISCNDAMTCTTDDVYSVHCTHRILIRLKTDIQIRSCRKFYYDVLLSIYAALKFSY